MSLNKYNFNLELYFADKWLLAVATVGGKQRFSSVICGDRFESDAAVCFLAIFPGEVVFWKISRVVGAPSFF